LKKGIHPELKVTHFVCGCGNEFDLLSTKGGVVHLEVCNQYHPFYTGKLKIKPQFLEIKGVTAESK